MLTPRRLTPARLPLRSVAAKRRPVSPRSAVRQVNQLRSQESGSGRTASGRREPWPMGLFFALQQPLGQVCWPHWLLSSWLLPDKLVADQASTFEHYPSFCERSPGHGGQIEGNPGLKALYSLAHGRSPGIRTERREFRALKVRHRGRQSWWRTFSPRTRLGNKPQGFARGLTNAAPPDVRRSASASGQEPAGPKRRWEIRIEPSFALQQPLGQECWPHWLLSSWLLPDKLAADQA